MSLENSKGYGTRERAEAQHEHANNRSSGAMPHQAPQRERVSLAARPNSTQPTRRGRLRLWTDLLAPERNQGVPQLMMILEPNVVWEHTAAYSRQLGKSVESVYCPREFLEGWHRAGRLARGVYEGSYWDLLGDCNDLISMLAKMSRAPRLLEEPSLVLPDGPHLPSYEAFRPDLVPLPKKPVLPQLLLPAFKHPVLEPEVPFVPPDMEHLPPAPPTKEDALPVFVPPKPEELPPFQAPEFKQPEPPARAVLPKTSPAGRPQYGLDWTGNHPLTLEVPAFHPPALVTVPKFRHPPRGLPLPPLPPVESLPPPARPSLSLELPAAEEEEEAPGPGPEAEAEAEASQASFPAAPGTPDLPCGPLTPPRSPSRPVTVDVELFFETAPLAGEGGEAEVRQAGRPVSASVGEEEEEEEEEELVVVEEEAEVETEEEREMEAEEEEAEEEEAEEGLEADAASEPGEPDTPAALAAAPGDAEAPIAAAAAAAAAAAGSPAPAAAPTPMNAAATRRRARISQRRPAEPDSSAAAPSPARADSYPETNADANTVFAEGSTALSTALSTAPQTPDMGLRLPTRQMSKPDRDWSVLSERMWRPRPVLRDHGLEALSCMEIPIQDLDLPPEPLLNVINGPEPQPEDFPPEPLEGIPAFVGPPKVPMPDKPEYPPSNLPAWVPPCEPRPVGFLRGIAPVLIIDVSGTMNPRLNGKMRDVKSCVCELLDAQGELGTAAGAFDVVAFCSAAWSWSAAYASRMELLTGCQAMHGGRQAGRAPGRPLSNAGEKSASPATLQPTEEDMLRDAQNWVRKWPDALGQTCMVSAFDKAAEHLMADCWYVFSDGLANDAGLCVRFLEERRRNGLHVPVIHTVGFFPEGSPDNYEGRRFLQLISNLTGGTHQEYDRDVQRIYRDGRFVDYNTVFEDASSRVEREWAEACLRAERKKNMRNGVVERLETTMSRVRMLHFEARIRGKEQAYKAECSALRKEHRNQVEAVKAKNARAKAKAQEQYEQDVGAIHARNEAKLKAARATFEAAHDAWIQVYEAAFEEWLQHKAAAESEYEQVLVASRLEAKQRTEALAIACRRTQSFNSSGLRAEAMQRAQALAAQTKDVLSRARKAPVQQQAVQAGGSTDGSMPASPEVGVGEVAGSPAGGVKEVERRADGAGAVSGSSSRGRGAVLLHPALLRLKEEEGEGEGEEKEAAVQEGEQAQAGERQEEQQPQQQEQQQEREERQQQDDQGDEEEYDGSGSEAASEKGPEAEARQADAFQELAEGRSPKGEEGKKGVEGKKVGEGGDAEGAADRPVLVTPEPTEARRPVGQQQQQQQQQQRKKSGRRNEPQQQQLEEPQQQQEQQQEQQEEKQHQEEQPQEEPAAVVSEPGAEAQGSPAAGEEAGGGDRPASVGATQAPTAAGVPEKLPEAGSGSARKQEEAAAVQSKDGPSPTEETEEEAEEAAHDDEVQTPRSEALDAERYAEEVVLAYANGFVRDVLLGASVRAFANQAAQAAAAAAHAALVAPLRAQNVELGKRHAEEVQEKKLKDRENAQVLKRWQQQQDELAADYNLRVKAAKEEHERLVAEAQEQYRQRKLEIDELNAARLREAEALHAQQVEEFKQRELLRKDEFNAYLKVKQGIEAANQARMAAAREAHSAAAAAAAAANAQRTAAANEAHAAAAAVVEAAHAAATELALYEWQELREQLSARNAKLEDAAREKYAAALTQAQAQFEAACVAARQEHAAQVLRVRQCNEELWLRVQQAKVAEQELARAQAFAEHIRACAKKMGLGTNLVPNTPNLDRVVEMQALNEALARAFPEYSTQEYPWPDHERRGERGSGWVAAPQARSVDLKDPAAESQRIARWGVRAAGGEDGGGERVAVAPAVADAQRRR